MEKPRVCFKKLAIIETTEETPLEKRVRELEGKVRKYEKYLFAGKVVTVVLTAIGSFAMWVYEMFIARG